MTSIQIHLKPGFINFVLLFMCATASSQSPLLLRSTLGTGGASISVSADGTKISFPQSIGQYGVTGAFNKENLILRQGFIQPVLTVQLFHEAENKNISVYPNPFSSVVFVKILEEVTGNIDLKIIDLGGKTVHAEVIPPAEIIQVNLNSLQKGIYVLSLRGNSIYVNYKIIKY